MAQDEAPLGLPASGPETGLETRDGVSARKGPAEDAHTPCAKVRKRCMLPDTLLDLEAGMKNPELT